MKIQQLTFLRFIAAIAIVFFHFSRKIKPYSFTDVHHFVERWNVGVSFFFVLSGFIMVIANQSKDKIDFRDFFMKRVFRIYPMYLLALFSIVIYHILTHFPLVYEDIFLNLILLQSWFPSKAMSYNFPSWTIPIEFFFYLIFPFIFNLIIRKISFKTICTWTIVIWIISQVIIHVFRYSDFYMQETSIAKPLLLYHPMMHLNQFFIGVLFGVLFLKNDTKRNYTSLISFSIVSLCLLIYYSEFMLLAMGSIAPLFGFLIYFIAKDNGPISVFFQRPFNIHLGEISYSLYILQFPVFLWGSTILNRLQIENSYVVFYACLATLLLLSHFAYTYFENPIRKKLYSKLSK